VVGMAAVVSALSAVEPGLGRPEYRR